MLSGGRYCHLLAAVHQQSVTGSLLVSDSLDGLSGTLVVVFLHVPVHGAELHLSSKVDVHRTLLHCGVDELI